MIVKTILVANNHLEKVGGSETFVYTLIEELLKRNYLVEYFTFFKGEVSQRIERDLDVSFMSKSKYDLILTNHQTCARYLCSKGKTIQTCHGIFPKIEQPSRFADGHVAISEEVSKHLKAKNFKAEVILNGINCNRYYPETPINATLQNVLSLTHSKDANKIIEDACNTIGVNFLSLNKYEGAIWHVENEINKADLVIGLGRSAYEAMACGRAVVVFDNRHYFKAYSDGYLTPELVTLCVQNNCSGRYYKKEMQINDLILELKKYNKKDGDNLRAYALEHFNIALQVDKYLDYAERVKNKNNFGINYLVSAFQKNRMAIKKFKRKRRERKHKN